MSMQPGTGGNEAAHRAGGGLSSGGEESRSIEIDLADLELPAEMSSLDDIASAASHIYERFVPYADDGWEWMTPPSSRQFQGWQYEERGGKRTVVGARLQCRRAASYEVPPEARPTHGLSPYRTRQLTANPWTAEPGSKRWRSFRGGHG